MRIDDLPDGSSVTVSRDGFRQISGGGRVKAYVAGVVTGLLLMSVVSMDNDEDGTESPPAPMVQQSDIPTDLSSSSPAP